MAIPEFSCSLYTIFVVPVEMGQGFRLPHEVIPVSDSMLKATFSIFILFMIVYSSFEPSMSFGQRCEMSHFSQWGLREVQT